MTRANDRSQELLLISIYYYRNRRQSIVSFSKFINISLFRLDFELREILQGNYMKNFKFQQNCVNY